MQYEVIESAQPAAPQRKPAPPGMRFEVLDAEPTQDFKQKTSGMSHEQIVEEYRKADINSPYYNHLVKLIEAPQQGETPHQAKLRAEGQQPAGAPSQAMSAFGGFAADRTYGFADEMGAGLAALGGADYDQALEHQRKLRDTLQAENPGSYLGGQLAGVGIEMAGTLGLSAPLSTGKRVAANIAIPAVQGGINGAGTGDTTDERLRGAAFEGGIGAGAGVGLGLAEGAYKGVIRPLARKVTSGARKYVSPTELGKRTISGDMGQDWADHGRLAQREAAAGEPFPERRFLTRGEGDELRATGQRTQVSDYGGDTTRKGLQAAGNLSARGATLMRGAAEARQKGQGARVQREVMDMYGGEINPHQITESLQEEGAKWNKKNYDKVFSHPKAGHLWSAAHQNLLSSPYGEVALKKATDVMKTDALANGVDFLEPVFQPNAVGRMDFVGFRALDGEMVQGHGLNLNFWNEFKIQTDQQIRALRKAGDAREAGQLTGMKNDMLKNIDQQLGDDSYSKARGDAKEIFDLVGKNGEGGALRAGSDYFTNMDAFSMSEARAALEAMNPMERELFSRGYAAELVNKIGTMGNTEDVGKLFKNPQQRMKLRDAIGEDNADKLEFLTHAEMAKGLLGKTLAGGSDTAGKLIAMEAIKSGGAMAGGYYLGGGWQGAVAGLALRGGFKAVDRLATERLSRIMSEIAISEDPKLINEMLQRAQRSPQFLEFSRAVADGAQQAAAATSRAGAGAARAGQGAGGSSPTQIDIPGGGLPGGAERIEPRMPFAGGGVVKKAAAKLLDYIVDDGAEKVSKKAAKNVDISDMPRLFDLSNLEAVPDVEQKMIPRYNPPRGVSERTQRLVKSKKVQRGVSEAMERGKAAGGKRWYNNDPLLREFVSELGPEDGAASFRDLMDYVAATSPRSKVPENARNSTYYYSQSRAQALPEIGSKNPAPYGHLAQKLHQMNARRVALDGWDPLNNPKPASFAENLSGNQTPGTMDTHATRLPAILSQDPEWLAKQLLVKNPETGEKMTLNPSKMYRAGDVNMRTALKRPAMWEAKPNDNEYAALEQMYADLSREQGMTTAQGQASAWAGGAEMTGLASVGSDPFLKVFEDRILMTAKKLGMDPKEVLKRVIHGSMPLLRDGGRVTSALGAAA